MQPQAEQIEDESKKKLEQPSILLHSELRTWWVLYVMGPVERFCVRNRISPNTITLMGLFFCCICGGLFAKGKFLVAGWGVLLSASLDILDGRVARATNRVTKQGAFLDSVVDRYQDFVLFAGLAIYFRHSPVFFLVLLAIGGASFVPYIRAKADLSGVNLADVGAMQRPERIFVLGFGSIISSIFQVSLMPFYGRGHAPPQHLLISVVALLAIATNLTAIRRWLFTMNALEDGK